MLKGFERVRPEERREVLGAFLTLFGVVAGHVMVETARDALFLGNLAVERLPFVYLGVAAGAAVIAATVLRATARSLGLTLALSGLVTAGFGLAVAPDRSWAIYSLYVWSGLFATLAAVQFWLVLARRFTVSDAKRLYALIGAGSVLGAWIGAGATAALSLVLPPRGLLVVAGGIVLLTSLAPLRLARRLDDPHRAAPLARPSAARCARAVATHPYVRLLLAFVIVGTATLTLADYIFKAEVAADVPAAELPTFLALFSTGVNGVALLAQLFLTGWLLRHLGVLRVLWILPLLLLGGSALYVAGGGLVAAMALEAADGSLKHSLHRTVTEVLYLPIPERMRRGAKAFIDTVGRRGAQAGASLLILGVVSVGGGTVWLAAVAIALAAVWIGIARALRAPYLELFRTSLREGAVQTRITHPEPDLGSVEALVRSLNSADDTEVLTAMGLLAAEGKTALIPALILHHPSEAVVLRALELFAAAGRRDFVGLADRLQETAVVSAIRAAALRARIAVAPDAERLDRAAQDPDPRVRATALIGLATTGARSAEAARAALEGLFDSGSREARVAVAEALAQRPDPAFCGTLVQMGRCPDARVKRVAARAMGAARCEGAVDALIAMLGERGVRRAAREALVAIGEPSLERLAVALGDLAQPKQIRLHLPRTVSRFESERAVAVLLERYRTEPSDGVRYKILRGLGRMRERWPELRFDPHLLDEAIERAIERARRLVAWRVGLDEGAAREGARATEAWELLRTTLRDKADDTIEQLFRLLGLRHPAEDLARIHRAATGDSRVARAGARELLEHLLPLRIRDRVLALLGDVPAAERLRRTTSQRVAAPADYEALLASLLSSRSQAIRALTAYHAGELRMVGLEGALRGLQLDANGYVKRVVDRALRLFEGTEEAARAI